MEKNNIYKCQERNTDMAQKVEVIKIFPYSQYAVVYWPRNGYTACWCMRVVEGEGDREPTLADVEEERTVYWAQGHYFQDDLAGALLYAIKKETEAWERHKKWLMDSI